MKKGAVQHGLVCGLGFGACDLFGACSFGFEIFGQRPLVRNQRRTAGDVACPSTGSGQKRRFVMSKARSLAVVLAMVAAVGLALTETARADLIPYEDNVMIATASSDPLNASLIPKYAINGAGLSGDCHGDSPLTNMWNMKSTTGWFKVDLGAVYNLGYIRVWNYNTWTTVNVKKSHIDVSDDDSDWDRIVEDCLFDQAPGGTPYCSPQKIDLPVGTQGRYVKLVITENYGENGYCGLSEVQFFTAPPIIIPEPAGLSLLGLAMLALRRRRA